MTLNIFLCYHNNTMRKNELLESKIGPKLVTIGKLSRIYALQTFAEHKYKITPEQFTILATLVENNGMYQRQIASITLKDRPNITRLLRILEKSEFITKQPDINKRKIYKIFITDKGREIYNEVLPTVLNIWQESVQGLNEEELKICIKALDIFRKNLEGKVNIQV